MIVRLRHFAILVLPAAALIWSFWSAPVQGQQAPTTTPVATGTPSATTTPVVTPNPTATATPSGPPLPAGRDLLTKSTQALKKHNSQHFVVTDDLLITDQVHSLVTETGDQSYKPAQIKVVQKGKATDLTTTPPKSQTEAKVTIVIVKKVGAQRSGKKAWACTTSSKASQNTLLPTDFIQGLDQADVQTVDEETINGDKVWDVRASQTVDSQGLEVPIVIDNFVRQSDFLPVRSKGVATASSQGQTLTETVLVNTTKFGEKVKISLPSSCVKSSSKTAQSVRATLVHALLSHLTSWRHSGTR